MTSKDQRPAWLNNIAVKCPNCQGDTDHLAFIETLVIDPNTKKPVILIEDFHHCKNCVMYHKTKTTGSNYKLFWDNTLSKRIDPKTGKLFTDIDPRTNAPLAFDQQYT